MILAINTGIPVNSNSVGTVGLKDFIVLTASCNFIHRETFGGESTYIKVFLFWFMYNNFHCLIPSIATQKKPAGPDIMFILLTMSFFISKNFYHMTGIEPVFCMTGADDLTYGFLTLLNWLNGTVNFYVVLREVTSIHCTNYLYSNYLCWKNIMVTA